MSNPNKRDAMQVQCECGKFRAELTGFPQNTPGRLVCYCDDCQTYMHWLGRADLLDTIGGTDVIPVYPSEVKILQGKEVLRCNQLAPGGMPRWSTTCCNTPIANTRPGTPWTAFIHRVYTVSDPTFLEKTLGPVRSRVFGRYAKGTPPAGTPSSMNVKVLMSVLPFMLKGALLGKGKGSPFFKEDGTTPIVAPRTLSKDERESLRRKLGF